MTHLSKLVHFCICMLFAFSSNNSFGQTKTLSSDCEGPQLGCIGNVQNIVFPNSAIVSLVAKDLVGQAICNSVDSVRYSFSDTEYVPVLMQECCEVDGFGFDIPYTIYAGCCGDDTNGNNIIEWEEMTLTSCEAILKFDDENVSGCHCFVLLNGNISTLFQSVAFVPIKVIFNDAFVKYYSTNSNGDYSIMAPLNATKVEIIPSLNTQHKNGVSTLDMLRIQKHLLGVQPFNQAYQFIAADVNNNNSLSSLDLIELRKLSLGIYTEFPNNFSWRFVSKVTYNDDEVSNFSTFKSSIILEGAINHTNNLDFIGIKIGDLNNSVTGN